MFSFVELLESPFASSLLPQPTNALATNVVVSAIANSFLILINFPLPLKITLYIYIYLQNFCKYLHKQKIKI